MSNIRRARAVGAAVLALALAGAAPAAGQADERPLDRERMTQYARAHGALNDARDEFHGKVGRVHDEQGRERARVEMEEQIAEALAAHELTQEEYDEITLLISLDGDARALFEEILAELAEETAPSG